MEEYITRHESEELEKIKKMMADQNKTYEEVIRDLLTKYKAEPAIVNQFMKTMQQQAVQAAMGSASTGNSPGRGSESRRSQQ